METTTFKCFIWQNKSKIFANFIIFQATMRKIRTQLNTCHLTSILNTDKIKSQRSTLTTTTTNIELANIAEGPAGTSSKQTLKNDQSPTKTKVASNEKKWSASKLSSTSNDKEKDDSIKITATSNQVVAELNQKFDKKHVELISADDDSVTTPKKIFRNEAAAAEKNAAKKKTNLLTLPSKLLFGRRQRSYTLND